MADPQTFGERVAYHRRRGGMSQREFAVEIGRSESWVSQVERGARSVDRLSVQQNLADVLGVPLAELQGEPSRHARRSDVQELRLALTGHPALGAVLDEAPPAGDVGLAQLADDAEHAWPLVHESRYDELEPLLAALIPALERAARQATGAEAARARELLAGTYQVAASMLARVGESDAAWIAADRAVRVAEDTAEPLAVVAGLFRMAHAFLGLRQLEEAHHVAEGTLAALRPRAEGDDVRLELLSLFGALCLVLAVIAARDGNRSAARGYLQDARRTAGRVGPGRNDFGTEFGPTNVEIHAISVAVDLGDAGEAVELAEGMDAEELSPERRFRLHLDVARAETQRRHIGNAVHRLAQAASIAPEHFDAHPLPRETVRDLMQLADRRVPADLKEMARRLGLLP